MFQASAPLFRQGLTALSAILDKTVAQCAERKIDPAVLLADRLAPDMYPFTRQVQLGGRFREEHHVPPRRARAAQVRGRRDHGAGSCRSGSRARWRWWTAYRPGRSTARSAGTITLSIGGQSMSFEGQPYLLHFALPNFFFHVTAAYAILRHNGIQIGKRDFIGSISTL